MTRDDDMNDSLDDLLGGPVVARPRPTPPESYRPKDFSEPCPKCRGRGRFISYTGRDCGPCFTCKGAGQKTFKAPAAVRADNREKAAARKAQKTADNILAFKAAHPVAFAWINDETAKAEPFPFAVAMVEALAKFGDLTERQLETCERLAAKAAERKAERAKRIAEAPAADSAGVERLKAAFDHAAAYTAAKAKGLTVRNPKITIGGMTISPAKAHSANPGALYVKAGDQYLGKIAGGRFHAAFSCTAEQSAKVLEFVANPAEAAKVYGQETGTCCICNATLRSEWRLKGIGPICAEKFGFA
jgi:Family of unknown function (DUF6011)